VNALRDWLARPLGWFTFVLAEYVVTIVVLRALMPQRVSIALGLIALVGVVAGLFVLNMWIRRRLPPADPGR